MSLYAFCGNDGVNNSDYLGMYILLGVRNGSGKHDFGHVFVVIVTGDHATRFDWYAKGGASAIDFSLPSFTFLRGDAETTMTTSTLNDFMKGSGVMKDGQPRDDISLYRIETTDEQDYKARLQMYEYADLAKGKDTNYDALVGTCSNVSLDIVAASGARTPSIINPSPSNVGRQAAALTGVPGSGWSRVDVPHAPSGSFQGEVEPGVVQMPVFTVYSDPSKADKTGATGGSSVPSTGAPVSSRRSAGDAAFEMEGAVSISDMVGITNVMTSGLHYYTTNMFTSGTVI